MLSFGRRSVFAVAAFALVLGASAPVMAAERARPVLIEKLDGLSLHVTKRQLVISASGAVAGGGWTQAHLRIDPRHRTEDHTLVVQFLATPPAKGAPVIQGLLPVSAKLTTRKPRHGITQVKVESRTNSLTMPFAIRFKH